MALKALRLFNDPKYVCMLATYQVIYRMLSKRVAGFVFLLQNSEIGKNTFYWFIKSVP